ncbi:MAG TPA: hypothetical protein VMF53_04740 [Alphaproteobacteria bacterium]|nr:hypothetical protein [Alphaproteobacteria bacterium]
MLVPAAIANAAQSMRLNPLAAMRLDTPPDGAVTLQVRALAPQRSWLPLRLDRDTASLIDTVLRIVERGTPEGAQPAHLLHLWRAGLLLSAGESVGLAEDGAPEIERTDRAPRPWLPPAEAGARLWRRLFADFDALATGPAPAIAPECKALFEQGLPVPLPALLSRDEAERAAAYWWRLQEHGLLIGRSTENDRFSINNDPLGRALLHRLTPSIEALIGHKLRESYSYATVYEPGAVLDSHRDRPQCQYTVSVLLDFLPTPSDGRSPWPLEVELEAGAEPARYYQGIGDGVLFLGRALAHGRPRLGPGKRCLVLMLHWLDADFPDAEMDMS